jgi:allantoate deiminase
MDCDVTMLRSDAIPRDQWLGYFEIHIEQGPVLYEKKIPAAIVTAIAGQSRVEITFQGMAAHAGTVPMGMRHDALCCLAEFIVVTEKYALENKEMLVATVGKVDITNAASNVIPGEVQCSLDVRSSDALVLRTAAENLRQLGETISRKRNIAIYWNLVQQTNPVSCDQGLNNLLFEALRDSGYEVISLVSGAGHDVVPVSEVAPVAMLFVRCFKGISHNPLEDVELQDLAAALQVAERFLTQVITHHS